MKKIYFCKSLLVNGQPCSIFYILKFAKILDSIENVYLMPTSHFNRMYAENTIKRNKDFYLVKPSSISAYKLSKSLACVLVDM